MASKPEGRVIPLDQQTNPFAFFLGRLDKTLRRNDLYEFLIKHVYVTKLDMPRSRNRDLENRGYCYVHCKTVEECQNMLSMPTIEIYGRTCYIHKYDDRRGYNPDISAAGSFYSNYSSYQSSLVSSNRSSRAQSPERADNPEEQAARQAARSNLLQTDGLPNAPSPQLRQKPTPLVLNEQTFVIDTDATPTVAKARGFDDHQQNIDPEQTPTTNPFTHGGLSFDQFSSIQPNNTGVQFINQAAAINTQGVPPVGQQMPILPNATVHSTQPVLNPFTNRPMTIEEAQAILGMNGQQNFQNTSMGQMYGQTIVQQSLVPQLVQQAPMMQAPIMNQIPIQQTLVQPTMNYNPNLGSSVGSNTSHHSYHSVHSHHSNTYDQNLVNMQNLAISNENLNVSPMAPVGRHTNQM